MTRTRPRQEREPRAGVPAGSRHETKENTHMLSTIQPDQLGL